LERPSFNAQSERPRTTLSKTNPTGGKEDHTPFSKLSTMPTPSGLIPIQNPSDCQLSNTSLTSHVPRIFEGRPDEVFALPNRVDTAQHLHYSTSVQASDTRELENSKDDAKILGTNGVVNKEVEVAAEGEGVTTVPCTHSPPIQLTRVPGNATGELITLTARTASSTTASQPSSMALYVFNSSCNPAQAVVFDHLTPGKSTLLFSI